jgi:hypothetical protein
MQEAKRGLRGPSETTGRKEAAEARGHAARLLGLAAEEAQSREHGAENGRGQTTAHDDTGAGGSITPVETALRTSLTVDEAEQILTRFADRGHLLIQNRDGVLCYALPGRQPSFLKSEA